MGKRGISGMVASVLIILMSIVAISILWMVVSDMIEIDTRNMNTNVDIVIGEGYTVCDFNQRLLVVQVKRGADKEVVDRVMLSFNFEGNSYNVEVDAPEPNGVLVHSFDIGEFSKCFDSASVAPIFNDSGIRDEGYMGLDVEIPENLIVNVPATSILISNPDVASCVVDNDCDDGDVCTIDSCVAGVCSETPLGVDCSDMIAWWRFEGDFEDETGNYDGVANGDVSFVDSGVGARGLAADFDGSGDYVTFGDIVLLDEWDWTIMYWSRVTASSRIAMGDKDDDVNFVQHRYGNNKVWINNALGEEGYVHTGSSLGALLHVVVRPNVTNDFDIYFDGVHDNEDFSLGSSEIVINSIGKGQTSSSYDWMGQLDEVMIFNRSLSQAEIDSLYAVFA